MVEYSGQNSHWEQTWKCKCDCGSTVIKLGRCLRNGDTKSCGCLWKSLIGKTNLRHGEAKVGENSREYRAWMAMKKRCRPNDDKNKQWYANRGISVCKRWVNSFPAFLNDMGRCPEGHQIDRLDNSKGYEPGNCAWKTGSENCNNKRNNRRITYGGKTQTVTQWMRELHIAPSTIWRRVYSGWKDEEILFGR